jgi:hypothetical protein
MKLIADTLGFREGFVTTCKKAGIPEERIQQEYHKLRIKEACETSPAFNKGFVNGVRKLCGGR